ncbi:MAG: hypothetical protein PWQ97_256, partial [Tepidanaerobacteraceae bacterium]|nr:hypothetical protein [Tepidanaerobacteraceae bacterium]
FLASLRGIETLPNTLSPVVYIGFLASLRGIETKLVDN